MLEKLVGENVYLFKDEATGAIEIVLRVASANNDASAELVHLRYQRALSFNPYNLALCKVGSTSDFYDKSPLATAAKEAGFSCYNSGFGSHFISPSRECNLVIPWVLQPQDVKDDICILTSTLERFQPTMLTDPKLASLISDSPKVQALMLTTAQKFFELAESGNEKQLRALAEQYEQNVAKLKRETSPAMQTSGGGATYDGGVVKFKKAPSLA